MSENLNKIEQLCKNVQRIIKHHEELAKVKGETFNVFSILKMESKENETHSAFLAELLNPNGSHNLGATFLQLFITSIQHTKNFQTDKAKVVVEYFVGNRNDKTKEGGRIDIFIDDTKNNSISIENKIYASDQYAQIERYVKHNKAKNTVYYLTLYGEEPSEESKGTLTEGKDYYNISYQTHIVNWLELCLKEAVNSPILRETIKQYILLIKKLTNTLNMSKEKELTDVLLDNLEVSFKISQNLELVKNHLKDKFLEQLKEIGQELNIYSEELFLIPSNWKKHQICFSYEGGAILIGVKRNNEDPNKSKLPLIENTFPEKFRTSHWWPMYREFYSAINYNVDFWSDVESGKVKDFAKDFIQKINQEFNTTEY